ncbi:MAG: ABC transporter substrate-binding protein [Pseudomonas sp.]
MKQRGRMRARSWLLLVLLLIGGCGGDPAGQHDTASVRLVLGDQARSLRTLVEASGAFEGLPYQVEWANFVGAAPLFEAQRAGAIDLGWAGDTPVLAAASSGMPLKVIASARSGGRGVAILVRPGSDIRSVADLRGRNVVVSSARGSVAQYLLVRALQRAGIDERDVRIGFALPTDALSAFNAGRIDAWATFGIYQAFAEQAGARVLVDGEGISSGLGFVTASGATLADPGKRRAAGEVLARLARAYDWARAHPREYAQVIARANSVPLAVAQRLVDYGYASAPLTAVADTDLLALQQIADLFAERGLFPHRIDAFALADRSVFPASGAIASHDPQPQPPGAHP